MTPPPPRKDSSIANVPWPLDTLDFEAGRLDGFDLPLTTSTKEC